MSGRKSIVSILLLGAVVCLLSLANPVQSEPIGEGAFAPWQNGQSTDTGFFPIAVDMQGKTTQADFQIKDFGTGKAEVLGEGRSLKITEGRFTDQFDPWGVHIYRIAP